MPRLIVTQPEQEGEQIVELDQELTIGSGPGNQLILETDGVSHEHARIFWDDNQFYLIDLESGRGTQLNNIMLQPHEKNLLRNNDLIHIGPYHLRFWQSEGDQAEEKAEEEEPTDTDVLEIKLLKKVLDAIDHETVPSIEVLNGVAEGKRVFLTGDTEEIVVGRDPNCDFPINEYVISRQHVKIMKRWGGVIIRDLGSKNGVFVNNRRVEEEHLHDGDRIALGTIVFLYRNPQEINIKELGQEIARKQKKKRMTPPPKVSEPKPETPIQEQTAPVPPQEMIEEKSGSYAAYPTPKPVSRLTAVEIGLIGLGIIVVSFALITIINLVMS